MRTAIGPEDSAFGRSPVVNAFSVDVEDYFQVEAFKSVIHRADWDLHPARVAASTDRMLKLLEAADVRATFFVLGWVAERFADMVSRIEAHGHEVASHGYSHELVHAQTASEFRQDIRHAKQLLEDIVGKQVRGFRAPTFSIGRGNWWAYEVLAEEGYEYSSSIYPISHDLYGMESAPRTPFRPLNRDGFLEIPVTTVRLLNKNRPCAGGGYFRLLPYGVSRWCMRRVNKADRMPCVFYCHPWEIDVDQPRIKQAPLKSQLRHYLNIREMAPRIARLLQDFSWGRIDDIYLQSGVVYQTFGGA